MCVLRDGGWIMPVVNACYAYTKTFTTDAWIRKIQKEERAGFDAAGLRRHADWKDVLKTIPVGARDVWRTTRTNWALYRSRLRLRRAG